MKKIYSILVFLCVLTVNAQEFKLSPFTQYLIENPFVISPTYAGIDDEVSRLRVSGVGQWIGLKNAPMEQSISFDTRLNDEKSGIGVLLYNDKNGATKQIGGQLSYAYHLTLNDRNDQYLSLGISYRFNHFSINTSDFHEGIPQDGTDDPGVDAGVSTANHNFEVGFLYRIEEFFFSLNASNLLKKRVDAFDRDEPLDLRNYYIYTGYKIVSQTEEYEFEPSIYLNYFESDQRAESHLNFKARKITDDGYLWAGINGKFYNDQSFTFGSIAPMIGLKKDSFYVGYAFQWNVNQAKELNHAGTHLLTLGYDFERGRGGGNWFR